MIRWEGLAGRVQSAMVRGQGPVVRDWELGVRGRRAMVWLALEETVHLDLLAAAPAVSETGPRIRQDLAA